MKLLTLKVDCDECGKEVLKVIVFDHEYTSVCRECLLAALELLDAVRDVQV